MNNVHDMGGLQNFGPVQTDPDDPLFHHDWEKQVLALTLAMGATGTWNIDESRFARESLPPAFYLGAGYYRIWLAALENLIAKHGLASREEMQQGRLRTPAVEVKNVLPAAQVSRVLAAGSSVERETTTTPRFAAGDSVVVKNQHCSTHTRLPAYIRGRSGSITRVHGCHVFPDSNAIAGGENPQWLYNVQFDATTLWGESSDARFAQVHVDCWEPYLESV